MFSNIGMKKNAYRCIVCGKEFSVVDKKMYVWKIGIRGNKSAMLCSYNCVMYLQRKVKIKEIKIKDIEQAIKKGV